jgi:hypothetical protein
MKLEKLGTYIEMWTAKKLRDGESSEIDTDIQRNHSSASSDVLALAPQVDRGCRSRTCALFRRNSCPSTIDLSEKSGPIFFGAFQESRASRILD